MSEPSITVQYLLTYFITNQKRVALEVRESPKPVGFIIEGL